MIALLALLLTLAAVGYAAWAGRSSAGAETLRDEMAGTGTEWAARGRSIAHAWSRAAGELAPRAPTSGSGEGSA